jgi:hypothetical protein
MVAHDRDDFDPRYSRYPMTFSDAMAALFRPRPKKVQVAAEPSAVDLGTLDQISADPSRLELIGAQAPASGSRDEHPPVDSTHAV